MKTMIRLVIVSILMMIAAPAWSGGTAVAVYTCEQGDTASEADVNTAAAEWLKAANAMKGGAELSISVLYPMAVTMGESDFLFVVQAPSFAAWGEFMDHYEGSQAAEVDRKFADIAICPDSALWESVKIGSK